ncbi:leucine-rich repeat and immunoglobulin-like domain-containing nogo receptor-interacting protein 4 [Rhinatrema bivittatum]|uniref:leucine-rich repeat and immunoglobulin-like domain-containing nogo receptor-interacting protein 4 n=1 Tax=Rhinatrema bivittatum TaxID=194408 RepID=UPI00112A928E|nr:leucine-rich repeat and immunoglobulin-like domain-containing nogo receptor-interacting protein 4 [Rhinatrema bivittatum]
MTTENLWPRPLLLALLAALAGLGDGCPARCECSTVDRSVLCSHRRLSSVPDGLAPDCQRLDLSQNRLRRLSRIMFGHPRALRELDLSQNLIARIEPGTFSLLSELRSLRLARNQLKTVAPGTFAGLQALLELDISHNGIALLLEHSLQELTALRSLDAGHNQLLFLAPEALGGLRELQWLSLEQSSLAAVPSAALARLPQLQELRLGGLNARALRPGSFPALPALRLLELDWWPALAWLEPGSLQGLNLSSLSLTRCNLTRLPWAALEPLRHLQRLDVSHNPLAELSAPPPLLPLCGSLRQLHLAGCRLQALPEGALRGLARLQLLNVSGNRLQTLDEAALPAALRSLALADNPLACDCRLRWVLGRPQLNFGPHPPVCRGPAALRGLPLADIAEAGQLSCEGVIPNCPAPCNSSPPAPTPGPFPPQRRLDARALAVVLAVGFLPFLSSIALCFLFIFFWSRGRGNIKYSAHIAYVPRQNEPSPVPSEDNKFTMKLM